MSRARSADHARTELTVESAIVHERRGHAFAEEDSHEIGWKLNGGREKSECQTAGVILTL